MQKRTQKRASSPDFTKASIIIWEHLLRTNRSTLKVVSEGNAAWEEQQDVSIDRKSKSSLKSGCVTETIFSTGSNCWTFDQLTTLLCQHSHTTGTHDNEHEWSCIPAFTYYTRWHELFKLQWRASRSRIQITLRPTIIKTDVTHQLLGDNTWKDVRKPEYRQKKHSLIFTLCVSGAV